jgi:serine/threonine protein kinase
LVHPHIIAVYDAKDIHGHVYFFMEICEGGDLFEFIQNRDILKDYKARHLFSNRKLVCYYFLIKYLNEKKTKGEDTIRKLATATQLQFPRKVADFKQATGY